MPSTLLRRSLIAFVLAFAAVPACAHAASTFTVDSGDDTPDASVADGLCKTADDTCTLRAAIQQANKTWEQLDAPDQIVFASNIGLIRLNSQLPEITTNMDIRGPGAAKLTLWGNSSAQQRVFQISWAPVRISGLTITHGYADTGGAVSTYMASVTLADCVISGSSATTGAGIYGWGGTVRLERSTVATNSATTDGGGVYAYMADVDVVDSTFDRNAANDGGAISSRSGDVTVTRSTLSHNFALVDGGALNVFSGRVDLLSSTLAGNSAWSAGGAISSDEADLTAYNSTIAGNTATAAAGGITNGGTTVLGSTIVAGNRAPSQPDMASLHGVASAGGNLIGDGTGVKFTTNGGLADQIGTAAAPIDPKLARDTSGAVRLGDRGGPTKTTTLLPGSPAIDRGADSPAPETDQRGFPRLLGAHVDVGAVEGAVPAPVVPGEQWTAEDTPLVFSARTGNAISFSEPEYEGTVQLSAADGTLALAGKPAVKVTGDGTGMVTLSGSMTNVAEALDGLVLTPARDASGPMTLVVTIDDDASATVPIHVSEINDPPIASEDELGAVDARVLIPFSELLRNDTAGPANEADQELTITAVGEPKGGRVELSDAGVVFTPETGYSGPAGFAYTLRDTGSSNHKHDFQSAAGYARFEIKQAPQVPVTPATPPVTPGDAGTVPVPAPAVAPAVLRTSLSRNAASANVIAVFSKPMDARTLTAKTVTLTTRAGARVPATVRYDAARRRVVLDPRGRLTAGMRYTATIRAGVKDAAGVPLAKSVTWRFTIPRRGATR